MANEDEFKRLNDRIDELDMILSEELMKTASVHLPAFAVAVALIDAGLIARARLIEITEALRDLALTHGVAGEGENEMDGLDRFRLYLAELPVEQGTGLKVLRRQENAALLVRMLRQRGAPPSSDG